MSDENLPATRQGNGSLATRPAVPAALAGRRKLGVNVPAGARGLRIPNLQICHKIETEEDIRAGKKPGGYLYAKAPLVDPVVVFLKSDWARRYEHQNDRGQRRTMCASGDGVLPLSQIAHPVSKACAGCPAGTWETGTEIDPKTGRLERIPPDCDEGVVFLGLLPGLNGAPFWFANFKTLRQPCYDFVNTFSVDPQAEALFQWVVRLSTKQTVSGGLKWYLPVFTVEKVLPVDDYRAVYEAAKDLVWSPPLDRGGGAPQPESGPQDTTDLPPPSDEDIPF